jgi:hypothetical protein
MGSPPRMAAPVIAARRATRTARSAHHAARNDVASYLATQVVRSPWAAMADRKARTSASAPSGAMP